MIIYWQGFDRDIPATPTTSPVYLSTDQNTSPTNWAPCEYTVNPDGLLVKAVVRGLFFPSHASMSSSSGIAAATRLAQQRVETMRGSLLYGPPDVRALARGKAVAPNVLNNFGKLVDSLNSQTMLDHCWLADAQIVDGEYLQGVMIQYTFAAIAATSTP